MSGDPSECRQHAADYARLAETAAPDLRLELTALADTWKRIAAEIESDHAFLGVLTAIQVEANSTGCEPYKVLPIALGLTRRVA
jgi:hypothetical protein